MGRFAGRFAGRLDRSRFDGRNSSKRGPGAGSGAAVYAFGELTRAGAGGIAIPSGATSISLQPGSAYTITGGYLVPVGNMTTGGAGQTGTIIFDNGVSWPISTIANSYSVRDGELAAVLSLGSATIDGKTVYGRPGADIGNSNSTVLAFGTSLSFTNGLTIRSHDAANPCYIRRMSWAHNGPVTFRDLIIRDDYVLADTYFDTARLTGFGNNASGRSVVSIIDCEMYSDDTSAIDGATVVLTGTNAAHTNGSPSTTVTLTGSPDLSGIATDGSMCIRIGGSNATILGKDNTAKTLTLSYSFNIAAGSPQTYIIGYTPQVLRLIGQDGGITNNPDLTFTGNNCHDYGRAIVGQYRNLLIEDNDFDKAYFDHLSLGVNGSEASFMIERNRILRAYGLSTDVTNPHVDAIQLNTGGMTVDNSVAYEINGNIIFQSGGLALDQQGIFLENIPDARRVLANIKHNVIMTKSANAIILERGASGSVIAFNTVLADTNSPYGLTPAINTIGSPTTPIDSGVLIYNNIAPNIASTSATETENYEFGTGSGNNDNTDYAALFTGTDFDSANIASVAAFLAALTPDGNATLWPSGSWRIGALGGYYDYDTGVESLPAAMVPAQMPSGYWSVADTGDGGTVEVSILTAAISSGSTVTDYEYQIDGGAWTSGGISGVGSFSIIGLTDDVEVDVAIRAVNGVGNGAASATKAVTPSNAGYQAAAVEFDGTNDSFTRSSGATITGTKTGIVSVWLRSDAASWPASGVVFQLANSGGTQRLQMTLGNANSSGNGRFNIEGRNASNTIIFNRVPNDDTLLLGTWNHVLIAWDLATTTAQVYISQAGTPSNTAVSSFAVSTTTNDTIESAARIGVGATSSNSTRAAIQMADLFVTIKETIDLSVEANRRKFIGSDGKPVDLGANGSTPTGTQPDLFMSGTWANNLGSGGSLTANGSLTTPATSPSD